MSLPGEVTELIERFDRNLDSYRSGKYNETQIRQEFVNPLFESFGWDIYNVCYRKYNHHF
jgi:predicted type IV restriction endonuclease